MKPKVRKLTIFMKSFVRDVNTQVSCWLQPRIEMLWAKSSLFAKYVT